MVHLVANEPRFARLKLSDIAAEQAGRAFSEHGSVAVRVKAEILDVLDDGTIMVWHARPGKSSGRLAVWSTDSAGLAEILMILHQGRVPTVDLDVELLRDRGSSSYDAMLTSSHVTAGAVVPAAQYDI
jgi:hypothetical protein